MSPSRDSLIRLLRSPWPRLVFLVLLLGTAGVLAFTRGGDVLTDVRGFAEGRGALGAVVFVLCYAVGTVALFPVSLLSAAAGVLYGPVVGVAVVWTGAVLGATGSFTLGRVLSRGAVEQIAGDRVDRLDAFLVRRGTAAMIFVRLVPLFPFGLVNYGSAATAIRPRQYVLGTAVGILPGTAAYVSVGGTATDPTSAPFLLSVGALVVLAGGGAVVAWRLSRA